MTAFESESLRDGQGQVFTAFSCGSRWFMGELPSSSFLYDHVYHFWAVSYREKLTMGN